MDDAVRPLRSQGHVTDENASVSLFLLLFHCGQLRVRHDGGAFAGLSVRLCRVHDAFVSVQYARAGVQVYATASTYEVREERSVLGWDEVPLREIIAMVSYSVTFT